MNDSERMKACKRLKKMATHMTDSKRLEKLWRAFPENYRDGLPVPPPLDILNICERMEREAEADKQFDAAMKQL